MEMVGIGSKLLHDRKSISKDIDSRNIQNRELSEAIDSGTIPKRKEAVIQIQPEKAPIQIQPEEMKVKLGTNAIKRVAAGAHLPTPWLFEPTTAWAPDDRADHCLGTRR